MIQLFQVETKNGWKSLDDVDSFTLSQKGFGCVKIGKGMTVDLDKMIIIESNTPVRFLSQGQDRKRPKSDRYTNFVINKKKHMKTTTLNMTYEESFNHIYRQELFRQFGDSEDKILKLHIEREMINGLKVESQLAYSGRPQKN